MSQPSVASRVRDATPILALIAFFAIGFASGEWRWAWLAFLAVPLVYTLVPGERRRGVNLSKEGDAG